MLKYLIIEQLKFGKKTSDQLASDLKTEVSIIRVTLNRMKNKGEVDYTPSIDGNLYFLCNGYSNHAVIVPDDNYKVAFEELYKFFMDVMQNVDDVVKDVDKWNEIWDKRQKDIVYKLGKELIK
jgi:bacterioferritin (cytochrome b1)